MKSVQEIALAATALALISGASHAATPPGGAEHAAGTAGTFDARTRDVSYVDVACDEDRSRGAVATSMPASGGSTNYRIPDPVPAFRWATHGEWRRHRFATPVGSATVPLT